MPENLGENIRNLRIKSGLTQEDLAKLVGTTKQNIYKYEAGIITNIPLDRIEALASVLHVSPIDLVGWSSTELHVKARIEYDDSIHSMMEEKMLKAFRDADPTARQIALETLENHPAKKEEGVSAV